MKRVVRGFGPMALLSLVACKGEAPPPEAAATPMPPSAEAEAPVYSPFAVEVQGDAPYREITFKQVGSMTDEVERSALFETLAESLALQLSGGHAGDILQTRYDPSIAEPAHHRACGAAHIYVDFWERHEGWGFSLWSGCSDEHRFAGEDVAVTEQSDLVEWVEPLTRRIAAALRSAEARRCFQRSC